MNQATPPVKFQCAACGVWLFAPAGQGSLRGPCPVCAAWITSPEPRLAAPHPVRTKGRVRADAAIDHRDLEKRESLQTLKILALSTLTAGCCLAAAWFLNAWLAR